MLANRTRARCASSTAGRAVVASSSALNADDRRDEATELASLRARGTSLAPNSLATFSIGGVPFLCLPGAQGRALSFFALSGVAHSAHISHILQQFL